MRVEGRLRGAHSGKLVTLAWESTCNCHNFCLNLLAATKVAFDVGALRSRWRTEPLLC